jgi:UDP-sulfoquinovose synthase
VINRFCVQAVAGIPLTVYGKGGQTRGFLPLKDSIKCITLALENPPEQGEYRVFNQFAQTFNIGQLACAVQNVAWNMGLTDTRIEHIDNPRKESEEHELRTTNKNLRELGYEPKWEIHEEIHKILTAILPYKDRINKDIILPKTRWN